MGDVYSNYNRIDRTFSKLEDSQLSHINKKHLKEFAEHLMAQNLSDHKIYRYIQSFRVLSHEIDFELRKAERKDLIRLIGKINQNQIEGKQYKPESRKELKQAIKKFYNWSERTQHPEILDFMSLTIKPSNRKTLDPSELPTKKQLSLMLDEVMNPRDGAMLHLLWESGARAGELLELNWKDIKEDGDLYRVDLSGKTGQRTVPVTECINKLDNWKKYQNNDFEAVFTSLQAEKRISYRCLYNQLKELGERADIDCKVNPHAFRKSRATHLASEGANIFQLMNIFGWSKADTAKVYVRLAQSDVDKLVLDVAE